MIFRLDDIQVSHLPEFKGGEKELAANMFFDGVNRIFKGRLVPGASIGVHTHEDSCEVIFVLSGKGALYECTPDQSAEGPAEYKDVNAGDCLYCPKGHTHSLMNPAASEEDLVFYAVVPAQ
jgi:mannose-6-phosphate isomerase-like protein (cupin superfamily)